MIPARLGSQRLRQKNLQLINGVPLITHTIRKCLKVCAFDAVWVNSESEKIGEIAEKEGAKFYLRDASLANNHATSEDFVEDFFKKIFCDKLIQVHSIAPLLQLNEIKNFAEKFQSSDFDCFFSAINDQIEVMYENLPVNFSFSEKTNSQDLEPVKRITWSMTGWKRKAFLEAKTNGKCATYYGKIGLYSVSPLSGFVIKNQLDLEIANALNRVLIDE